MTYIADFMAAMDKQKRIDRRKVFIHRLFFGKKEITIEEFMSEVLNMSTIEVRRYKNLHNLFSENRKFTKRIMSYPYIKKSSGLRWYLNIRKELLRHYEEKLNEII